jgi:PsbP
VGRYNFLPFGLSSEVVMLGKCTLALALIALGAVRQDASAGEFIKADKHYRLKLEDYWTANPPPGEPLDAAFLCDEKVCGKRVCQGSVCNGFVQFVTGSAQLPDMQGTSQSEFFRDFPASEVRSMAEEIATTAAHSFKELSAPRRLHFGRNDYYVTEYDLLYKTGASRSLMYVVTFNRGYFYQLQFFTPAGALKDHRPRFEQVLSSMEFLEQ